MVVENMPEFPWRFRFDEVYSENVRYPAIAKEYNITGKVYITL